MKFPCVPDLPSIVWSGHLMNGMQNRGVHFRTFLAKSKLPFSSLLLAFDCRASLPDRIIVAFKR
jgi:hypothetical protein